MVVFAKRRILVRPAVIVALLVLSGCSAAEANRPVTSPQAATPSRASGRPLTADQLKALALTDSEVPQAHDAPVQAGRPEGEGKAFPPASDAACQRVLDGVDAESSSARVVQTFNWKENIMGGSSVLASYEGGEAENAFRRLRDALRVCRSFTGFGWAGEYQAEVVAEQAPDVGDEALAFHLVSQVDGRRRDEHHVLVRVGGLTAGFTELNVDRKAVFPLAVIRKQVDRLGAARHR
ncbi:hypothetical protein [Streptomyces laurentii]|uniref:hypothetical protein n=1 Tax=Streptomyces laurentii TaxID=39478 RepID=UPI0036B8204F